MLFRSDLILAVGDTTTVLAQGEMGIGKSSILSILKSKLPDHHFCYGDMTTKDVGDFLVPKIRSLNGTDVCSFIPNEEFGFHFDKPIVLMLDEIGKASKAVMNACLRLMLERKLGTYSLPEGSIVFATTNLANEAIGDNLPPHARNRISVVKVRKPSADEWIEWALDNDSAPEVLLTVKQFPQMLASFEDYNNASSGKKLTPKGAFFDDILKNRKKRSSGFASRGDGMPPQSYWDPPDMGTDEIADNMNLGELADLLGENNMVETMSLALADHA